MAVYGGIEAGGTKFVCAVGSGPEDIRAEVRFATSSPEASLSQAIESSERRLIEQALEETNGRVFGPMGAATRLGISSSTLESKIKRLRINKHQYRSSIA